MKKSAFALALSLCLVLALLPASARAASGPDYTLQTFSSDGGQSCWIDRYGTLWSAGYDAYSPNYDYRAGPPAGSTRFRQVMSSVKSVWTGNSSWESGGIYALKNDNTLWGWNTFLVGDGSTGYTSSPVKILSDVACYYAAGIVRTKDSYAVRYALKTDGSLWGWGYCDVGDGTKSVCASPVKIMDGVRSVCVSERSNGTRYVQPVSVYAVKTDGALWGWGTNGDFCLYSPDSSGWDCPNPVKILDDVVSVTANTYSLAYAVKTDGSLWAWGSYPIEPPNSHVRFNGLSPTRCAENAARVSGDTVINRDGSLWRSKISYEGKYSAEKLMDGISWAVNRVYDYYAVDSGGALWYWDFRNATDTATPVRLADGVAYFRYTFSERMALKTDGTLWMEGNNSNGEFGNGTKTKSATLIEVADGAMMPLQSGGLPFVDVRLGVYCYEPVGWAVDRGVTTGTTASTFSPNQTCTQGQILTFLWRAAGKPEPSGAAAYTSGAVTSDKYYYKALAWAAEKGVVTDLTLDPNASCSRSDAVLYLWRYAGSPAASAAAFADVPADAAYAGAVSWAVSAGVTTGTTVTTFSPESSCTRGQIVTFLWRDIAEK